MPAPYHYGDIRGTPEQVARRTANAEQLIANPVNLNSRARGIPLETARGMAAAGGIQGNWLRGNSGGSNMMIGPSNPFYWTTQAMMSPLLGSTTIQAMPQYNGRGQGGMGYTVSHSNQPSWVDATNQAWESGANRNAATYAQVQPYRVMGDTQRYMADTQERMASNANALRSRTLETVLPAIMGPLTGLMGGLGGGMGGPGGGGWAGGGPVFGGGGQQQAVQTRPQGRPQNGILQRILAMLAQGQGGQMQQG